MRHTPDRAEQRRKAARLMFMKDPERSVRSVQRAFREKTGIGMSTKVATQIRDEVLRDTTRWPLLSEVRASQPLPPPFAEAAPAPDPRSAVPAGAVSRMSDRISVPDVLVDSPSTRGDTFLRAVAWGMIIVGAVIAVVGVVGDYYLVSP